MIGKGDYMCVYECPDGFDTIDTVYLVEYDNGEPYEDNYHDIQLVFDTREDAEKYLDNRYVREKTNKHTSDGVIENIIWRYPQSSCSMNNIGCDKCPKYMRFDEESSEWVKCEERYKLIEPYYDESSWCIIEYDVIRAHRD